MRDDRERIVDMLEAITSRSQAPAWECIGGSSDIPVHPGVGV